MCIEVAIDTLIDQDLHMQLRLGHEDQHPGPLGRAMQFLLAKLLPGQARCLPAAQRRGDQPSVQAWGA
ncbi:hypothetical protein D3C80_2234500 [compost metagenome]